MPLSSEERATGAEMRGGATAGTILHHQRQEGLSKGNGKEQTPAGTAVLSLRKYNEWRVLKFS